MLDLNFEIDKAISYRNQGLYEDSLNILLELSICKEFELDARLNIHLVLAYCLLMEIELAIKLYLQIQSPPIYLTDSLFIALLRAERLNEYKDLFSGRWLKIIECSQSNSFDSIGHLVELSKSFDESSARRLNEGIWQIFEYKSIQLISKYQSTSLTDRQIILKIILSNLKDFLGTTQDFAELLFAYNYLKNDILHERLQEIIRKFISCQNAINLDAEWISILDDLAKTKYTTFGDRFVSLLLQGFLFPLGRSMNETIDFKYAIHLYRYYHKIAKIIPIDSLENFVSNDLLLNSAWYGNLFVKSAFEYSTGKYKFAEYSLVECEKEISHTLGNNPHLIENLQHICSSLCWKPSYVSNVEKQTNLILPKSYGFGNKIEHENKSQLCFVLGADVKYTNSFFSTFLNHAVKKNPKNAICIDLGIFSEGDESCLVENCNSIDAYLSLFVGKIKCSYRFFTHNFIAENGLKILPGKGFYTLLRYFSLLDLMVNRSNLQYFLIIDIDCYPMYSNDLILHKLSKYDVVLSAIHSIESHGIPSYIGAGALAVKNNENGRKFVRDLISVIMTSLSDQRLTVWNLDQAAIRSAITNNRGINYGYFPKIGNVIKFANAYESKSQFVEKSIVIGGISAQIGLR